MILPRTLSLILGLGASSAVASAQIFLFNGTQNYGSTNTNLDGSLLFSSTTANWNGSGAADSVRYTPLSPVAWATAPTGFPNALASAVSVFLDREITGAASQWALRSSETAAVTVLGAYPPGIPSTLAGQVISDPLRYVVSLSAGPYPDKSQGLMLFPIGETLAFGDITSLQVYHRQPVNATTPVIMRWAVRGADGTVYLSQSTIPNGNDMVSHGSGTTGWRYPNTTSISSGNWASWQPGADVPLSLGFPSDATFGSIAPGGVTHLGIYLEAAIHNGSQSYDIGAFAYTAVPEAGTSAMLAAGGALLVLGLRRRRTSRA